MFYNSPPLGPGLGGGGEWNQRVVGQGEENRRKGKKGKGRKREREGKEKWLKYGKGKREGKKI